MDVFLGLIQRNEIAFDVLLVNASDVLYDRVVKLTGAFASQDDDLLETSKSVTHLGPLGPHSSVKIDEVDVYEFDFVVWYELDLIAAPGESLYLSGYIPKGGPDKNDIAFVPELGTEATILSLSLRINAVPIETVKNLEMNSRYTAFNKKDASNKD